jgi:hypothetical protein
LLLFVSLFFFGISTNRRRQLRENKKETRDNLLCGEHS